MIDFLMNRTNTPASRLSVVILAAGMGSRLGSPKHKCLTDLSSGETILSRQLRLLREVFGASVDINVVVGFKADSVIEAADGCNIIYNDQYDVTNTSKSVALALRSIPKKNDVLWLNGDVVCERGVLELAAQEFYSGTSSFVCAQSSSVADEEMKVVLDRNGNVKAVSKQEAIEDAFGEAVGVNLVRAGADRMNFLYRLNQCAMQDYFEAGLVATIPGTRWSVVDVSAYGVVEVDFADDLVAAERQVVAQTEAV